MLACLLKGGEGPRVNASYGYTLLRKETYSQQKIAVGSKAMIKWTSSPRLRRFKLLSSDTLIASLARKSVKFDSLYFAGE